MLDLMGKGTTVVLTLGITASAWAAPSLPGSVLLRAANALECTLDDLLQLEFTEPPRIVMEVREYSSAEVKGFLQKLQAGKKT